MMLVLCLLRARDLSPYSFWFYSQSQCVSSLATLRMVIEDLKKIVER